MAGIGLDIACEFPKRLMALGAPGLHFHDLRHTGNHFAASSGVAIKDLMARIGA
jgi:hypothetical protein